MGQPPHQGVQPAFTVLEVNAVSEQDWNLIHKTYNNNNILVTSKGISF
jgi:hypothetical protein